jgi:hypothetical protein
MTISQHSVQLLHTAAPGVDGRCGVVVGCVLLGKLAREHKPSDHGGRLPSRRLFSLHAKSVLFLHPLIGNIMAAGAATTRSMRFLALIDHDGRICPTVAVRPHSWLLSIQQSTNILGNRLVLLKLEKLSLLMFIS